MHRAEEKALRGGGKPVGTAKARGDSHTSRGGGRGERGGRGGGEGRDGRDRGSVRGSARGRGARGGRGGRGEYTQRPQREPKYGVRMKKRKSPQLLLKSLTISRGTHSKTWSSSLVKLQIKFFLGKQPKVIFYLCHNSCIHTRADFGDSNG